MRRFSTSLSAAAVSSLLVLCPSASQAAHFTILYSFCSQTGCVDGSTPHADLIDVGGLLYGTTRSGGTGIHQYGTAFSVNPATGAETVLHSFCSQSACADGDDPEAGFIEMNGILYGTTNLGGANSRGTILSLDPGTGAEAALYSFAGGTDGANPVAALIAVKGKLYGTTSVGGGTGCGGTGCGTVFSFDPGTGTETVLHSFAGGTDGATPVARLLDLNGTLYGATQGGGGKGGGCYDGLGCGTVFSLDPKSGTETVLHAFGSGTDGTEPMAGLVEMNGSLYGTSYEGGASGLGTVFSVDPGTGAEEVIYNFGGTDGAFPEWSVIGVNGILYGTTPESGTHALGGIFSLDPATGVETVVYSFGRSSHAHYPNGLIAVNGKLYGTTFFGGNDTICGRAGCGTVFRLKP